MLTIFQFFAAKTEASVLRMLQGSPYEYLHKPIIEYLEARGAKIYTRRRVREILFTDAGEQTQVTGLLIANGETEETITADAYVCAGDVPGAQRLLPQAWRKWSEFDNIYKLDTVPVATVQLRFDGWVTELHDAEKRQQLQEAAGMDNLLYTPDADFSCFADLAFNQS